MPIRTILPLAVVAIPISLAMADEPLSNPETLPKVSCNDIHYSSAFLEKYPKAPAACLEGRLAHGEKWAKFNAKVYLVNLPDFVTVEMLDVAGLAVTTFSLKPSPTEQVVVNGQGVPFSQVRPGDVITLWFPEKRFEAKAVPVATATSWIVFPPQHK